MDKQVVKEICYVEKGTTKYLTVYEDTSAKLEYINPDYYTRVIYNFPAISKFDEEYFNELLIYSVHSQIEKDILAAKELATK